MIGIWSAHSIIFTKIVAISLFVSFCVPMILVPMKWAKVLQWTIPDHNHLAVYFGRCLGGMAAILALFGWRATTEPGVLPITETIEIGFWVGLIVLSLCFYPIP
ncbi:MAG: hypothetical protein P8X96_21690 [Desulfobacteraceae bacterium]